MILIADGGSTKTQWVLLDGNTVKEDFYSQGINPYTQTDDQIGTIIKNEVAPRLSDYNVEKIFYYGAGCSTTANCTRVHRALSGSFYTSSIEINHDLLASCKGTLGNREGIAVILGTGSNSCHYDGRDVVKNIPALGYILGDEGSGAHLGKLLVKALLYEEMPMSLAAAFTEEYKLNKEIILHKVYKEPNPNRFLASFSPFIKKFINEVFFHSLVKTSFDAFFSGHIIKYKNHKALPFGATGSVAYHFSDILHETAAEYGSRVEKIIISPMEGLVKFHSESL